MQTSFFASPVLGEPLKLNYKDLIQEKLAYIPADYLAYLYQIVSLMAQKFEPICVSVGEIEGYAQAFRCAFELMMKQDQHFHVAYQFENECVWVQWISTDKSNIQTEIGKSQLDTAQIAQENETDLPTLTEKAQEETQILFTDGAIVFCKSALPIHWTAEKAQADARELFGVFMQHLPTYKADEQEFSAEN